MENLFPKEFEITQEIIDEGRENLKSVNGCIGALALKKAFPDAKSIMWANTIGEFYIDGIETVTTEENVKMMDLKITNKSNIYIT